jgi:acyl-CoA reductase-like NAD-dependent aldehyde dehydrogenase
MMSQRRFFAVMANTVAMDTSSFSLQKGGTMPMYLAGKPITPNKSLPVINKYSQEVFCTVPLADSSHVEKATAIAATVGAEKMKSLPPYVRQQILMNVAAEATKRRDEFAYYLAIEAGKPITDARGEADRLIQTFQLSAEEATRIYGEYADLQIAPRAQGYTSITKRVPIGPVSLISPFNL